MAQKVNFLKDMSATVDGILNHVRQKRPEQAWMSEIHKAVWDPPAFAHDEGKRWILKGYCVPPELTAAFDCANLLIDAMSTRLASQVERTSRYIDLAEKYVPSTLCGLDKVDLGIMLSGDFSDKPDAFIYGTVPCDNARAAFPAISNILGVPSFCVDIPFQKNERSYRYMAEQYKEVIHFMENLTGRKMDWDKFFELVRTVNTINRLETKIGDLRKQIPCPLPGSLLVLNELIPAMSVSEEMVAFMEKQYELGKAQVATGKSFMPGGEQFRVSWLQNMLWSNVGTLNWLEKTYGAVVVMDGFGYAQGTIVPEEALGDPDKTLIALARRELNMPMVHGAAGPVSDYIKMIDFVMEDFHVDVPMFIGHVGCKHTWAVAKIIRDRIHKKYGLPTLALDVDAVDGRYKSTEEIRSVIGEYMDTLLENREKQRKG
jgi:benzoyl-CoA reductase/2-hydroxyglutaryl-CoA dehydratase subunit BcrC/BadD/HgdB